MTARNATSFQALATGAAVVLGLFIVNSFAVVLYWPEEPVTAFIVGGIALLNCIAGAAIRGDVV